MFLFSLAEVPLVPLLQSLADTAKEEEVAVALRQQLYPHALQVVKLVRFSQAEWQALLPLERAVLEEACLQWEREKAALFATACSSKEGLLAVLGSSELRESLLVEEAAGAAAERARGKEIR